MVKKPYRVYYTYDEYKRDTAVIHKGHIDVEATDQVNAKNIAKNREWRTNKRKILVYNVRRI